MTKISLNSVQAEVEKEAEERLVQFEQERLKLEALNALELVRQVKSVVEDAEKAADLLRTARDDLEDRLAVLKQQLRVVKDVRRSGKRLLERVAEVADAEMPIEEFVAMNSDLSEYVEDARNDLDDAHENLMADIIARTGDLDPVNAKQCPCPACIENRLAA